MQILTKNFYLQAIFSNEIQNRKVDDEIERHVIFQINPKQKT